MRHNNGMGLSMLFLIGNWCVLINIQLSQRDVVVDVLFPKFESSAK